MQVSQGQRQLKQRTERMRGFADIAEFEEVLMRLTDKQFVQELARWPGPEGERFIYRRSEDLEPEEGPAPGAPLAVVPPPPRRHERIYRLVEAEVTSLREKSAAIKAELGV